MEIGHPFRAITPTLDGDVLQVLAHLESSMTPGRLHQHLGGRSEAGIRKCLDRLARQGIVSVTPAGNAFLYGLNRQHLLATQVLEIANLRRTFLDRLRVELSSWEATPFFAALFGSANRGEMRADSDIDLFVVRSSRVRDDESWRTQVRNLESAVTKWTGNDTRVLEMSSSELRRALEVQDPVVRSIKEEGTILIGRPLLFPRRKIA
jgi:predicted nucleotidyltransferase